MGMHAICSWYAWSCNFRFSVLQRMGAIIICAVSKPDFPEKGGEVKNGDRPFETGIRLPCGSDGARPASSNLGGFGGACFPLLNKPRMTPNGQVFVDSWPRSTGAPPSSGPKPRLPKPPRAPRKTYVPPALVPCKALTTFPRFASLTTVRSPSGSEVDVYFTTSQS